MSVQLIDLIHWLSKQDPDTIVPHGFGEPHSFRGYYDQLAFEPVEDARLGDMLSNAESALGKVFEGYRGGSYLMDEYTDCWISEYGTSQDADKIGSTMLKLWGACARTPD